MKSPDNIHDGVQEKIHQEVGIADIPPQYRGMTAEALHEIWADPSNISIRVDESAEDRQKEIRRRADIVKRLATLESKFDPSNSKEKTEAEKREMNNPENLSPEEILRQVGILSNELVGGNHPSVPDIGLANGTFAGSGTLNFDNEGNVVLKRVADNEDHLTKNWVQVGVPEMIDTSVYHGGGQGIPTSGFARWTDSFKGPQKDKVIGTFKIPAKAFLEMIKKGDAVLGNIGEGEIVLNPAAAKQYLSNVEKKEGQS